MPKKNPPTENLAPPKIKKKPGPKPGQFAQKHGVHVAQSIAQRSKKNDPSANNSADKPLPKSHAAFAAEWFANNGNATKAYTLHVNPNLNPSNTRTAASALLAKPAVQAEIRKLREIAAKADAFRLESFRLTRADVLARLAMLAVADLPDAFTTDANGRPVLKSFSDMPAELRSALSEVSIGQAGRLNAKVYDKQAALMNYAKLSGWLVDQQQFLGADGTPTNPAGQSFVLQILRDGPGRVVEAEPVEPAGRDAARELDRRLNALR